MIVHGDIEIVLQVHPNIRIINLGKLVSGALLHSGCRRFSS